MDAGLELLEGEGGEDRAGVAVLVEAVDQPVGQQHRTGGAAGVGAAQHVHARRVAPHHVQPILGDAELGRRGLLAELPHQHHRAVRQPGVGLQLGEHEPALAVPAADENVPVEVLDMAFSSKPPRIRRTITAVTTPVNIARTVSPPTMTTSARSLPGTVTGSPPVGWPETRDMTPHSRECPRGAKSGLCASRKWIANPEKVTMTKSSRR